MRDAYYRLEILMDMTMPHLGKVSAIAELCISNLIYYCVDKIPIYSEILKIYNNILHSIIGQNVLVPVNVR